ncbi:HAD-IA family hydrolase [Flavobacteriaceae bacterium]|nr:HAD-IA family hydrolase [Flavobacteriaceae bacterium]
MHYKALIFDMDGTLMDNMSYHKQSWIELFNHHKLDLDYDTFDEKYHKGSLVEIMARLFPEISDIETLRKIGSYKEELYRELYRPHVKSISGLILFLENIFEKNIPMGLATMGDQHNINFTFKALNLKDFFHSTTGGHEVKKGKPHPEIFLTAAEKIGVNPSDCLAFEDTLSGILSAKAAGMDVIGVTTMFDEKTLMKMGCKKTINNYKEIKV